LKDSFATAFDDADEVVVTRIYPASEKPIEGVTGALLSDAMIGAGHPSSRYEPVASRGRLAIGASLKPGDLVLTLGAGDIHEEGSALARDLKTLAELRERAPRTVMRLYEPLGAYTTFKAGGCAQFYAEPSGTSDLAALSTQAAKLGLPLFVLGRGSNLLVRDGGLAGVVVRLIHGEFPRLEVRGDLIEAGAGVRFKQIASAAKTAGIGGFEWMDGIPGAVGGGLRMNAGAMGAQTFDHVVSVRTMDRSGRIHERHPEELGVEYRHAHGLDVEIALSAILKGTLDSADAIQKRLDESMTKRKGSQPIGASAGCIFKNPPGDAAGRLIDACGLKNRTVGAARVSDIHANFIVNDGGATATDILALIEQVRGGVREQQNVDLRTELQIVGSDSPAF
jgi:UDP-N-acetylenolpyruvoylglucosamine reductase